MSPEALIKNAMPDTRQFDVDQLRADFPILGKKIYGKPLVYLDNASSAQKPRQVLDKTQDLYVSSYANVHRGVHYLSNAATSAYENARRIVADFLSAGENGQIIFTSGATDAINLVASSYGDASMQEGDEIILSVLEHHSNIVPWHFLRERKGVKLRWLSADSEGVISLSDFASALNPRTKLVALTHMSNALGYILPVAEIIALAHEKNIPVLLDGSQAAVHLRPDVSALDVDFYVMTGHKLYGPSGIGVLYGKMDLLTQMRPYRGGGEMIDEVRLENITYAQPPARFEAGTPPFVQAIGLGAALEYMMALDWDKVQAHEMNLREYAISQMQKMDWLKLYGPQARQNHPVGSIISFAMNGVHPHDVTTLLDRYGVALRAGHHCAQPLMKHLGVTSLSRASFAFYNTRDEIDLMVQALRKCREFFA